MKFIKDKIYIKIIFFGTALAGKTTSLQWLFDNIIPDKMKITDDITSIKTSFGQTLLFDFVPIQLGNNIILRMYTATGQDYYRSTRKMLFEEADGIFFIIDSQKQELEHNKEFVEEFQNYLSNIKGVKDADVIVLYNKHDLNEVYTPDYLKEKLGLKKYPFFKASAVTGENLKQAFIAMLEKVLSRLKEKGIA